MICAFIAGLFAGLAVITRTSELLWLAPSFFIIWLFYARRIGFIKLILFFAGLFLALLPIAYWNTILYQNPWSGGYNEMNRSLAELSSASGAVVKLTFEGQIDKYRDYFQTVAHNIFYFGFNPTQSVEMARHYILEMFPFLVYLAALGFLLLLVRNLRHFQKNT